MRRLLLCVVGFGAWLGAPAGAQAHTTLPGAGDFANGLAHPVFTPAHLLLLIALSLWCGRKNPLRLGPPLAIFAAASAASLFATTVWNGPPHREPMLCALALLIGILLASDVAVSTRWYMAIAGIAAFTLGCDSAVDTPGMNKATVLAGTWLSLSLIFLDLAFYRSLLPDRPVVRIGTRIAGSWIGAISVLMIAFALRR